MTRISRQRGLAELRRNTELFIQDSPSRIRLLPHYDVPLPGGTSVKAAEKPRPPQDFRLIPVGANMNDGIQNLEGMDISKWTYHLIGKHDSDMEVGDTWRWRGITYRIISLLPQNNWERRALVTIFGKAPPENLPPTQFKPDQIFGSHLRAVENG